MREEGGTVVQDACEEVQELSNTQNVRTVEDGGGQKGDMVIACDDALPLDAEAGTRDSRV